MKKSKVTETVAGDDGTLDLISDLPESLLVRILSLLPTTKDAVKTCLVSKRWQYLWTFIHNLTFTYTNKSGAEKKFVSVVDNTFTQLTCSKIRKFHLELVNMPSYIDQWLSYVVDNKVEHVVLKSDYHSMYTLPQIVYTCSSLITLHLSNCVLDSEVIVKLLSGCPALETLELSTCSLISLEINSSSLRRLKLKRLRVADQGGEELEISAPYLQHLEISGDIYDFKCRLVNVSSLVSAEMTFVIRCFGDILGVEFDNCRDYHHGFWTLVQDYLHKLSHVTELTIGTWFVEVLFMLQFEGVQLPELKCKCLVKLQITKFNLYGVASLLRASVHVETLNIDMDACVIWRRCRYDESYFCKGDYINLESWISNCAFPSLKRVNIICYRGMCWRERYDKLFELLELLLKKAMVLERFFIMSKSIKCFYCSENCVSPYLSQLAAKLSSCPRPTSNFMMILHESDFID